ncbi:MAG: Hint domain-containing protein [Pseudomonadota bacterium]
MPVTLGSAFLSDTEVTALGQEHSFANGEITGIENDVTFTSATSNEPYVDIGDTLTIGGVNYTIVDQSGGQSTIEYDSGSGPQTITGNATQYEIDDGAGNISFVSFLGGPPGSALSIPAGAEILGYTSDNDFEGDIGNGWTFDYASNPWSLPIAMGAGSDYDYGTTDYAAPPAPCFTPGTLIETPNGLVDVDTLDVGDLVMTKDNGAQPLRWIFKRTLAKSWMLKNPGMTPVMIKANALGANTPSRDSIVSPGHMMLIDATDENGGKHEVLVPARQLVASGAAVELDEQQTTYIHLMFDNHEVVKADGAWSESFRPGPASMHFMGSSARRELLTIFPELASPEGLAALTAVRPSLYRGAARRAISAAGLGN